MINHIDALDPFIVVGIFPRPVTPMSKVEVFNIPLIGFLTEAYGTIPIQRGQGDSRALRRSLQVLKEGGALLISPEGTRSPTYSLQRGKEGMALLAARTGAPIIPVAITGTEQRGRYWRSLRRVPVRIAIGKTFHLEPGEERPRRPILRAMTDEAMYRLAATLPPEYRGIYSNLDKVTQVHVVALPNSVEEAFDGIPQIRTHRPEGINPLPGNHDDGLD
jgi:1-acyl-sn-glycerol-3-phosphate acyltransferase